MALLKVRDADGNIVWMQATGAGTELDPFVVQHSMALPTGAATAAKQDAQTDALGADGASPPSIAGTGIRGWLRAIYERLSGTLTVGGTVAVTGAGDATAAKQDAQTPSSPISRSTPAASQRPPRRSTAKRPP